MLRRLVVLPLMLFVLVAGLAVSTTQTADAQTLERIVSNGVLRVGMSGNQAPYNAVSRTGDMIGLDVDLAHMLAGAFGVNLDIVVTPFPQLLPALEAGEVDIIISGMAITAERTVDVSFVGPYLLTGNSILTNSTRLAAIDSAGQINRANLKLAALENSTSHRFVQRFLPEAQLITTQNYDDAVAMVLSDEIDALVADMSVCLLSMLRYPGQGLATLNQPLALEPAGIAMRAGDAQLENLIRNYLWAFEGTGLLEALRAKWLEDGSWIAALP